MDIKSFWTAVLQQNADAIREFFHPDAWVNWHNTNEHFTVDEFICANCEYPGAWDGEVEKIITTATHIITATHVYSKDGSISCHATSFFRVVDGKIASVDEYWGDDGPAPMWRKNMCIGTTIRKRYSKADYSIRLARHSDYDLIYALKSASVRPYVEKIWGWDEHYQKNDFDNDFSAIDQFHVIEVDGKFAGFMQFCIDHSYYEIIEIHLLSEYRGKGIGSDILQHFQTLCDTHNRKIRIGCFKENDRAKNLYQKLGFVQTEKTDTHYILEYGTIEKGQRY